MVNRVQDRMDWEHFVKKSAANVSEIAAYSQA